jgi:D-aminoacyl-tRNA deacylase
MRAVIQRVHSAHVCVFGGRVGSIDKGLLVYLGIGAEDTEADANWMLHKLLNIRVFPNAQGKLDLALGEASGQLLVVSQFTLYGSLERGLRPSFTKAMAPAAAKAVFERFCERVRMIMPIQTGIFGADMLVSSANDGPLTLYLDSRT